MPAAGSRLRKVSKPSTATATVRRHRERMRAQGMRIVQFWAPDTSAESFGAEARRQSLLVSRQDRRENLNDALDAAAAAIEGWTS